MATSGTFDWTLDIADVIEEAYEQVGVEARDGYDLTTARRSINLLLTDWINRGVNLWTLDEVEFDVTSGTSQYTLNDTLLSDNATVDVIQAIIQRDGNDLPMEAITYEEYQHYTDKTVSGRAHTYSIRRVYPSLIMDVYPTPDNSTDTIKLYRIRYVEDVTHNYRHNPEIPRRFLPALTSGLAYKLGMKFLEPIQSPQGFMVNNPKLRELKREYDEVFQAARDEDRDRAPMRVVPYVRFR